MEDEKYQRLYLKIIKFKKTGFDDCIQHKDLISIGNKLQFFKNEIEMYAEKSGNSAYTNILQKKLHPIENRWNQIKNASNIEQTTGPLDIKPLVQSPEIRKESLTNTKPSSPQLPTATAKLRENENFTHDTNESISCKNCNITLKSNTLFSCQNCNITLETNTLFNCQNCNIFTSGNKPITKPIRMSNLKHCNITIDSVKTYIGSVFIDKIENCAVNLHWDPALKNQIRLSNMKNCVIKITNFKKRNPTSTEKFTVVFENCENCVLAPESRPLVLIKNFDDLMSTNQHCLFT